MNSSDMSSFKKESMDVMSIEQSYVFPHAITALATTSTKFGITAKDLIGEACSSVIHETLLMLGMQLPPEIIRFNLSIVDY